MNSHRISWISGVIGHDDTVNQATSDASATPVGASQTFACASGPRCTLNWGDPSFRG
jgi:hypothetical protein